MPERQHLGAKPRTDFRVGWRGATPEGPWSWNRVQAHWGASAQFQGEAMDWPNHHELVQVRRTFPLQTRSCCYGLHPFHTGDVPHGVFFLSTFSVVIPIFKGIILSSGSAENECSCLIPVVGINFHLEKPLVWFSAAALLPVCEGFSGQHEQVSFVKRRGQTRSHTSGLANLISPPPHVFAGRLLFLSKTGKRYGLLHMVSRLRLGNETSSCLREDYDANLIQFRKEKHASTRWPATTGIVLQNPFLFFSRNQSSQTNNRMQMCLVLEGLL